jgi:hypothetical protein
MTNELAPAHLSFSQVGTILQCSHRFYLERILRAPQNPAWYFAGGSTVHAVTEEMDANYPDNDCSQEDIDSFINHHWAANLAECDAKQPDRSKWGAGGRANAKETQAWWEKNIPIMVKAWQDWRASTNLELAEFGDGTTVEMDFTTTSYGFPFKGAIDRIMRDPATGALILIDIKCGSRESKNAFQLAFYRDAVQELLGERVRYGAYWMARKGTLGEIHDLDRISPEMTMSMAQNCRTIVDMELWTPNVSMLCGSCGVQQYCQAVGGSESLLIDGE